MMDISTLPFNNWLGIVVDGSSVRLAPTCDHLNHLETVHATVIYGVAESAAGHWLINTFPKLLDSHVTVLRSSKARYRRPAVLGSDLIAAASSKESNNANFASRLLDRGRATIEFEVSVKQNEIEVFKGTFSWFAARSN